MVKVNKKINKIINEIDPDKRRCISCKKYKQPEEFYLDTSIICIECITSTDKEVRSNVERSIFERNN